MKVIQDKSLFGEYPNDDAERVLINSIIKYAIKPKNPIPDEKKYLIAYTFLESEQGGKVWDSGYGLCAQRTSEFVGPYDYRQLQKFVGRVRSYFHEWRLQSGLNRAFEQLTPKV